MGEGRGEGLVVPARGAPAAPLERLHRPLARGVLRDGLRVLALRAEPPDLAPGDATRLDSLVVDTRAPGRTNSVMWFALRS